MSFWVVDQIIMKRMENAYNFGWTLCFSSEFLLFSIANLTRIIVMNESVGNLRSINVIPTRLPKNSTDNIFMNEARICSPHVPPPFIKCCCKVVTFGEKNVSQNWGEKNSRAKCVPRQENPYIVVPTRTLANTRTYEAATHWGKQKSYDGEEPNLSVV